MTKLTTTLEDNMKTNYEIKEFNLIKYIGVFLLITLFLVQCGGSVAENAVEDATETAAASLLVQASVSTATEAVDATASETEEAEPPALYTEVEEEDLYAFVLSSETHDCYTSGTFYIDADNNLISFDECVNSVAGSTLTADGDLTVVINDNGMTAESDISVEMEWSDGEYGQITQLGTFTSEIVENISTIDFEDFDGEVTCAGETIAYHVYIDYDLDTDLIDGDIKITYDGISTDCTFDDFDLDNATAAEWYAACGGLSF